MTKKPITKSIPPRRGDTLFEVIERRVVGAVVHDPSSDQSPVVTGFVVAAAEIESRMMGDGAEATAFEFTFEGITFTASADREV